MTTKRKAKEFEEEDEIEEVQIVQPRILLTRLHHEPVSADTFDLKSTLRQSGLVRTVQFNYMVEIDWFMSLLGNKGIEVLFLHGMPTHAQALDEQARKYANVKLLSPHLPFAYGTHHSKAMLLFFANNTMQVIIHTANMIPQDWALKTQGAYCTPRLTLKKPGTLPNPFETDLVEYLGAYGSVMMNTVAAVKKYDFSACNVRIVASVPGRFMGKELHKWGHMKLRSLLMSHGNQEKMDKKASFVLQASSIGSLGKNVNNWLRGELLASFSAPTTPTSANAINIVFPTVQEVRNSLEGYAAGGSIPFSSLTYEKQKAMMRPLLHSWKAEHSNRSRAMPHIKTFCRVRSDNLLDWFVLTSANISKAAWGSLEKKGCQLMIRSYEMGVLILPTLLTDEEVTIVSQQFMSKGDIVVPLPYDLPLTPYTMQDLPWLCDVRHKEPDLFGEQWP